MWDPRKRFQDYMTIDFRSNILEYNPLMVSIRFIVPDSKTKDYEIWIKLFYAEQVVAKVKWIAGIYKDLGLPVMASCIVVREGVVYGQVAMKIENFPVFDFAKHFKIARILDKGVTSMKAMVSSASFLKIMDPLFFNYISNVQIGRLSINSVDKETKKIIDEEIVVLPLVLQAAAVN